MTSLIMGDLHIRFHVILYEWNEMRGALLILKMFNLNFVNYWILKIECHSIEIFVSYCGTLYGQLSDWGLYISYYVAVDGFGLMLVWTCDCDNFKMVWQNCCIVCRISKTVI